MRWLKKALNVLKKVLNVLMNIGAVVGMFLLMYYCFKADERRYLNTSHIARSTK